MLPPGVSEGDFRSALQEFANVVGDEWVFADDESVALYTDPYSPQYGEEDDLRASAAVAPTTVEEVSAIMRIANTYKIPIYAFSTGKNLGYGGSAPVYSGSVILDLKRMNRIIEVDDTRHYAIVEPGVTLFDLYHHLQDNGYKMSIEMMDPAWGSVIGNALDHGCAHTTTYGRDRFHDQCGMEVVLPTGEVVRTGMGALPGSNMFAQFHYGFGPYIDGMFSQSNFGVVTKMGFQLRPEHEAYRAGMVYVRGYDDFQRLIEWESHCTHSGIANGMTHFVSPIQGPMLIATQQEMMAWFGNQEVQAVMRAGGRPDPAALERIGREQNIPIWGAYVKFHGPENVIAAQWEYCREKALADIPGATAEDYGPVVTFPLSAEQETVLNTPHNAEKVHLGIPSLNRFAMTGMMNDMGPNDDRRQVGHLYFAPMIPKTAEAVLKAQDVMYELRVEHDMPVSPMHWGFMPMGWYHRSLIYLMSFDVTKNKEINKRSVDFYRAAITRAAENGWGEYRSHSLFQSDVMAAYSWNDNALLRLHETIKDALDPNGVLAAGKAGIWPRHLRNA